MDFIGESPVVGQSVSGGRILRAAVRDVKRKAGREPGFAVAAIN